MPYAGRVRACPACLSVFASEPEFCVFDGHPLASGDALFGRTLGGYRFEGLVGVGGTSCVFRGVHEATGAPCAIKLLYGEMATDRSVAERFRREAEAVRSIDHPNVVQIFNTGRTPAGLTYLVMELIEGPTLKTIIDEEAPLAPRRAGRLAQQIVAGLAEAHNQGFVHRDLKPGNIMVKYDKRGAEQVKILDFGIVASVQESHRDQRLTRTGYIVGTPTYMAPEQVDPKTISPQADVYALGVIMYELLAGEPPFSGSLEQILVAKMTQRPPPLLGAGDLGDLILNLLEADQALRPPNALRVSAELSRISLLSDAPPTVRAHAVPAENHEHAVRLFDRTKDFAPSEDSSGGWSLDTRPNPMLEDGADTDSVAADDPLAPETHREADTAPVEAAATDTLADPPMAPAGWHLETALAQAEVDDGLLQEALQNGAPEMFDLGADPTPIGAHLKVGPGDETVSDHPPAEFDDETLPPVPLTNLNGRRPTTRPDIDGRLAAAPILLAPIDSEAPTRPDEPSPFSPAAVVTNDVSGASADLARPLAGLEFPAAESTARVRAVSRRPGHMRERSPSALIPPLDPGMFVMPAPFLADDEPPSPSNSDVKARPGSDAVLVRPVSSTTPRGPSITPRGGRRADSIDTAVRAKPQLGRRTPYPPPPPAEPDSYSAEPDPYSAKPDPYSAEPDPYVWAPAGVPIHDQNRPLIGQGHDQAAWRIRALVAAILLLSALVGFVVASRRDDTALKTPTMPSRQP